MYRLFVKGGQASEFWLGPSRGSQAKARGIETWGQVEALWDVAQVGFVHKGAVKDHTSWVLCYITISRGHLTVHIIHIIYIIYMSRRVEDIWRILKNIEDSNVRLSISEMLP